MNNIYFRENGSFRDRSGFIFSGNSNIYRQINISASKNFDFFITSGLYQELIVQNLIISHKEVVIEPIHPEICYKIIQPEVIPFISYPYEWSFSQLKDAALTTLKIEKIALEHGMTLKDASAFNIQFYKGKPIFIDTLSFEIYQEGSPWVAYRQFCQHFLAPLYLMHYRDVRLNQIFQEFLDGIPLDLASKLLPFSSKFNLGSLIHIHIHGKSQQKYSDIQKKVNLRKISRVGLLGIISSLTRAVESCKWLPKGTEWVDYYSDTNYTPQGFEHKKLLIKEYLSQIKPSTMWDIGANTGEFSQIGVDYGAETISFDIDPGCIEALYLRYRKGETSSLPIIQDLTNPSPNVGWNLKERMSLISRGPADVVMALALIHHLTISNNVPFTMVAEFLSQIADNLIIEFVPKEDSQVQRLLCNREDIFVDYSISEFEKSFEAYFNIIRKDAIVDSLRLLYSMKKVSK